MKNTYKIEGFEDEGGMSHAGGWEARGMYGRDDGMSSNSNGMSSNSMYAGYDRGNSYRRGHYVRGHYSRDDGMRDMAEQLDGMMNDNSLTAGQKDALRKAKEALMK